MDPALGVGRSDPGLAYSLFDARLHLNLEK